MKHQRLLLEQCDPDQLLEVIDGTQFRHRVLPGGKLCAEVEKLCLDASVLQRGFYGMGILADGALPGGVITVGLITGKPADTVINGFCCLPLSIQLYCEGAGLTYRAAPKNSWVAYCVEREKVQAAALRLYGRPLPIPYRNTVNVESTEADGLRIAATVEALFALGAYPVPGKAVQTLVRQLEERLIYELACAINNRRHADCLREAKCVSRRRSLMRRAEDYLRANLTEPFNLKGFATAVGVSHRMLEHHFRKIYGVSPRLWFRCMKLNEIRAELQQLRGTGERISDIAMRWGFLHLGRFSEDYRRLFGECPQDTLRR
ncbi:MAG: helix-turn-helix domain-containing protein [Chromatiaceae bacterium]|nr:helix-turn-helix domain-containing protein [Chromatiaceae bacterium]